MAKEYRKELKDYLDAVESQLNLLESTPLTDGGTYPWSSKMFDQQLFMQNQIDIIKDELENFDDDDDKIFNATPSNLKSIKPIISKSEENTDRTYILGLCDKILGEVSLRQYPYQFLVKNNWVSVYVDAYYMAHNLIIEYFCGGRRRVLPSKGAPIVNISYKDFGISRKLKRDESKDKNRLRNILQNHIRIKF